MIASSAQNIEVIDARVAAIYARMSPEQRLKIALDMWVEARELVRTSIRQDHPEWPTERVHTEAARRMLGDPG